MLLQEIQKVNINVDAKFASVQGDIVHVRTALGTFQNDMQKLQVDITQMRSEMCTKAEFEQLEQRVHHLESNSASLDNPDVKMLQQQLDKLDPAHRSISFLKVKSTDAAARIHMVEKFLLEHFGNIAHKAVVENVMKGLYSNRSLSEVVICELPSKSVRDAILTQIREKNLPCKDNTEAVVKIDHAKTKKQLARNASMLRANELLSKDSRSQGKNIKIEWKTSVKGQREITVAGLVACRQSQNEMSGQFHAPYEHLHVTQ